MTINDILEIEQTKYCYEQAYALHRHTQIPALFLESGETGFAVAEDAITGFDAIRQKFCEELSYVSPAEDSYHTGWQICVPLIYEDSETGEVRGIFPTFGYLILNMDPSVMKPPYRVLSTLEMWQDRFARTEEGGWKIRDLQAKFLLGQAVWTFDPARDTGYAVRHALRDIPHPLLGKDGVFS
jgi:hypothetical protein